jgi:hypothetical protein
MWSSQIFTFFCQYKLDNHFIANYLTIDGTVSKKWGSLGSVDLALLFEGWPWQAADIW